MNINELPEDLLLADGLEEGLLGYIQRPGESPVAIYDREKVLEILCRDMGRPEAEEYFEFNIAGAWVGDRTPGYLVRVEGGPSPIAGREAQDLMPG